MKVAWQRSMLVAAGTLCGCLVWVVAVRGQAAPEPKPQMAEEVFKNIQVLKGIPVDEFMDTMGMFAAATAKDCTGCHAPEILSGSRDAFAKPTPMIQMARMMTRDDEQPRPPVLRRTQTDDVLHLPHRHAEPGARSEPVHSVPGRPRRTTPMRWSSSRCPTVRTRWIRFSPSTSRRLAARSGWPA